jgi:hypothetical protein
MGEVLGAAIREAVLAESLSAGEELNRGLAILNQNHASQR